MGLVLGALVALVGCRDSPTDPMSGLVAGETDLAALALELPLLRPGNAGSAEGADPDAVSSWRDSWREPTLEGRRIRQGLYTRLGEHLAATRSPAELDTEVGLLGAAVRRAGGLDLDSLPTFLSAGVERARDAQRRARRHVAEEAYGTAWAAALAGADALREVGPEAVARSVVLELEERLRRLPAAHSYSDTELERVRHLVRGGRHAVEEADWGRALRRAFYARELLAGNG